MNRQQYIDDIIAQIQHQLAEYRSPMGSKHPTKASSKPLFVVGLQDEPLLCAIPTADLDNPMASGLVSARWSTGSRPGRAVVSFGRNRLVCYGGQDHL